MKVHAVLAVSRVCADWGLFYFFFFFRGDGGLATSPAAHHEMPRISLPRPFRSWWNRSWVPPAIFSQCRQLAE